MSMDPYAPPSAYPPGGGYPPPQSSGPAGLAPLPAGSPPYADFWIRVAAHLIDQIIFGCVLWVVISVFLLGMGLTIAGIVASNPNDELSLATVLLIFMQYGLMFAALGVAWVTYYVVCEALAAATPGKMLLGLKIVGADGRPIGWGAALLRFLGRFVNMGISGLGYLTVLFTAQRQALHELISSTYVIRTRP